MRNHGKDSHIRDGPIKEKHYLNNQQEIDQHTKQIIYKQTV